jgi:hypothetical protein
VPNPATANMQLVMPTENSDAGTWDATINDAADLIDAHDHSTGKGVKVKPAGLDINADLSFTSGGTPFAATALKAVDFTPVAASSMSAYAGALFTNSSDSNNLYFRTQAGSNVRITNGAQLDFTVAGGIGGDYASVGAAVAYVDASDTYTLKQQSPGNWARLQAGALRISEYNTTESTYVELACPAALAGNYTITPATALPGATSLVQISTAGQLSYSNTVPLLTASAGVTASVDQHITVSGTGRFKHGNMVMHLSPFGGFSNSATGTSSYGFSAAGSIPTVIALVGSGDIWRQPIPLSEGHRIRSITFYYIRAGGTIGFSLVKTTLASGAGATVTSTTAGAGTSYTSITLSSIDYTVISTETVSLDFNSGAVGDRYAGATITYDLP